MCVSTPGNELGNEIISALGWYPISTWKGDCFVVSLCQEL
jgi:hypothetical protein